MAMTTTKRGKTTRTMASNYYVTPILLLLAAATSFQVSLADTPLPRIVGGQDADFNEYPFFTSWGKSCGATLIHDDILLTAAHCNPVTTKQVIVGAYAKSVPMINSELRDIERRIIHPLYNVDSWNFDVMLLKLKEPVTNVEKVKLNNDPLVPAVLSTVTPLGLGRMAEVDGTFPMFLQEVNVRVVDSETCNSSPAYPGWIQDSMLCAGVTGGGQDACFGDSGGPLLQKNFETGEVIQVGVVSFGTGCARPGKPGVYHRVSSSYDWIQQQICRHSDFKPESCNGGEQKTAVVLQGAESESTSQAAAATTTTTATATTTQTTTRPLVTPAPTPHPVPLPTALPTLHPTPTPPPQAVPLLENEPDLFKFPENPPPLPLGVCQGDCDKDSDCAEGLFCFYKTSGVAQKVPGCKGDDSTSTDFCVDIKYRSQVAFSNPNSPVRYSALFGGKNGSLRGSSRAQAGKNAKPIKKKVGSIIDDLQGRLP